MNRRFLKDSNPVCHVLYKNQVVQLFKPKIAEDKKTYKQEMKRLGLDRVPRVTATKSQAVADNGSYDGNTVEHPQPLSRPRRTDRPLFSFI